MSTYDIMSQAFLADLHPTLHRMRAEDPVHWHPQLNAWILTRHDDVLLISRDWRFSAERADQFSHGASAHLRAELQAFNRFMADSLTFMEPPRHTMLRALVSKAFTPRVIEALRPFVERVVDDILDSAMAAGEMDIVRELADPVPALVIARMLGIPSRDIGPFKQWTRDLFALFGGLVPTEEAIRTAYRGVVGLQTYFHEIIAQRRRSPDDSLVSRLIEVEEQGVVLSEPELVGLFSLLLVAGHEPTTHLIGNAVLALLRNPAQLHELRTHSELMPGAVEELLRYDGAASLLARRAIADVGLGGKVIRADQLVFGLIQAANHDPAHHADPDRLDLTRKDVKSLGFGQGVHFCLGAALGRMEAQIVLGKLLERLSGLALTGEALQWLPNLTLHGLVSLPVTFQKQEREAPA